MGFTSFVISTLLVAHSDSLVSSQRCAWWQETKYKYKNSRWRCAAHKDRETKWSDYRQAICAPATTHTFWRDNLFNFMSPATLLFVRSCFVCTHRLSQKNITLFFIVFITRAAAHDFASDSVVSSCGRSRAVIGYFQCGSRAVILRGHSQRAWLFTDCAWLFTSCMVIHNRVWSFIRVHGHPQKRALSFTQTCVVIHRVRGYSHSVCGHSLRAWLFTNHAWLFTLRAWLFTTCAWLFTKRACLFTLHCDMQCYFVKCYSCIFYVLLPICSVTIYVLLPYMFCYRICSVTSGNGTCTFW